MRILAAIIFVTFAAAGFIATQQYAHALMAAPPADVTAYSCQPENFTLTRADNTYTLRGAMDMPSPGYSFSVKMDSTIIDGKQHGTITFTAPDGMALTVIDTLQIEHSFTQAEGLNLLTLDIGKSFNWGEHSISCARIAQ